MSSWHAHPSTSGFRSEIWKNVSDCLGYDDVLARYILKKGSLLILFRQSSILQCQEIMTRDDTTTPYKTSWKAAVLSAKADDIDKHTYFLF